MALLSISIDICGSTALKQKIVDISGDNNENITRLYEKYTKFLYLIEKSFYRNLVSNKVDIKNLFLVKGIGDELWYLYELEDIKKDTIQFNTLFHSFMQSLINTINSTTFFISDRDMKFDENMADPEGEFETVMMPLKIYMDYITDYHEITSKRFDFFSDYLRGLSLKDNNKVEYFNKQYVDYLHKLNVGVVLKIKNKKIKVAQRTDFIGLEIDRFFRATKFALPGIFTCGESLVNAILFKNDEIQNVNDLDIYEKLPIVYGDNLTKRYDYFYSFLRKIDKSEMKGINVDYVVYYIFHNSMLDSWILHKSDYLEDQYELTRKRLKELNYKYLHQE